MWLRAHAHPHLERVVKAWTPSRHRQHPARLPHRPVPHHGAGHQRQMLSIVPLMAGGGMYETAPAARRQARQQLVEETTCAGIPRRVLALAVSAWRTSASRPATPAPRCWPRPWTRPPASCSTTKSPSPKTGTSTTAAASSTSRCTGPRPAEQKDDAELAGKARPLARPLADNEQKIVAELRVRASRWTSAAATTWPIPKVQGGDASERQCVDRPFRVPYRKAGLHAPPGA